MQKIKACVICKVKFVPRGTHIKTCSCECSSKLRQKNIDCWQQVHRQERLAYFISYRKTHPKKVRDHIPKTASRSMTPWAPMHYDVLAD